MVSTTLRWWRRELAENMRQKLNEEVDDAKAGVREAIIRLSSAKRRLKSAKKRLEQYERTVSR